MEDNINAGMMSWVTAFSGIFCEKFWIFKKTFYFIYNINNLISLIINPEYLRELYNTQLVNLM